MTNLPLLLDQDQSRPTHDHRVASGVGVGEPTCWRPAYGKRGDKVTAYVEINVVEDGNAMTGRLFGGRGSATFVGFFDAGAKQIKWLWVNSGGATEQALINQKDGKWTFQGTGSLSDGTKTEYVSTVTISDNGNMHTWTGSGKVGDKKTDDQHDEWRRVNK